MEILNTCILIIAYAGIVISLLCIALYFSIFIFKMTVNPLFITYCSIKNDHLREGVRSERFWVVRAYIKSMVAFRFNFNTMWSELYSQRTDKTNYCVDFSNIIPRVKYTG